MDLTKSDIQNKLTYGETLVNSVVSGIQNTLVTAAANPEYISAVGNKDIVALNKLNRLVFESNKNILRIVILDAQGDGVTLYPFGTFDQKNFAFRDYYQESKRTGLPYITDVYTSLVDQSHKSVVLVSAPITTTGHEFVGILGAYINLDALAVQLQAVADPRGDEHFSLVDRKSTLIVDRDTTTLNSKAPPDAPILLGLAGKSDIIESSTKKYAQQAIMAYAPLRSIGWAIEITAPLTRIFQLSDAAGLTVFSILMTVIVLSSIAYVFEYRKMGKDSS